MVPQIYVQFLCSWCRCALSQWHKSNPSGVALPSIYGNYRVGNDQMIGIDRFVTDDGQDAVLYSEYIRCGAAPVPGGGRV
jgi:hypothetical protein